MKSLSVCVLFLATLFAQEKPVTLYPGLGTWRHPIATRLPEAQKFFDQGLILLYSFNRYEALRSFRKVAELDPRAAMAYWGIAMALGPHINMDTDLDVHVKESCDAVNKGLRAQDIGTVERDWLNAAASRCPGSSESGRYIAAMRALAARYPDDPDAQTLYAEALMVPVRWRWYRADGVPAEGVAEAERLLETVLRRNPYHPGANHLYIHAVESSPTPERAVPSAQRLMAIVPTAGHMVHMPGHIWLVLGDFENTVAVNERAAELDRQYFARTGVMGSYYGYYLHNLHFILYARSMQGRVAATMAAGRQLSDSTKAMSQAMPEMAGMFDALVSMAQLRLYRWDDVLGVAKPASQDTLLNALWRYSRAVAFAGKSQLNQARQEQADFERLRKTVAPGAPWGNNKSGSVLEVAAVALDARLAASPAAAIPKWKRAVELQDALVYDEPPAWYYPVRESLGAAMMIAGDAPGAEAVFREGLRRSPNNGRMLFGLWESLKAQKKTDAAAWVEREFVAAWKGAEIQLRLKDL